MSHKQTEFELLERRLVPASVMPQVPTVTSQSDVSTEAQQWSPDAWNLDTNLARLTYGLYGYGQTVAIIDTGIAYDHTGLGAGFGPNHRVVGGWDFAENDANPYDDGPLGFHGTHVAGIVGGDNSSHTGVAPGADLVALRVFDDNGNGESSWITSALWWVHEHQHSFEFPITTVNLSVGISHVDASTRTAMDAALRVLQDDGVFISVASGNDFAGNTDVKYPASSAYATPVGSVGPDGSLSSFSMRNNRILAAPGESIVSTVPDYLFGFNGVTDDYMAASGTSMAAPHVAGASVLLRETYNKLGQTGLSQQQLYHQFFQTSDLIVDSVTAATYRRLNLQRALDNAIGADESANRILGTLQSTVSFAGTINSLQDVDRFTFTAATSGSVTLENAWTGESHQAPTATIVGATQTAPGRFQVLAGQTYTLSLTQRGSIGKYNGQLFLQAANSSTVAAAPSARSNQSLQTWTSTASGWYDIQIQVSSPQRVDEIRILSDNGQLRYLATQIQSQHQVQLQVAAGERLTFALVGYHPSAEVTVSAMSASGGRNGGGSGSPNSIVAGIYFEAPTVTTHFALAKPGELALESGDVQATTDEALSRTIDPIWLPAIAAGNEGSAKSRTAREPRDDDSEPTCWLETLFADSLSLTVNLNGEMPA